jgi:hypothetical protein
VAVVVVLRVAQVLLVVQELLLFDMQFKEK